MSINNYSAQSGRLIKENGNVINWADSIDATYGLAVDVKRGTVNNDVLQVTLQNAAGAIGNGTILATNNYAFAVFDVRGTFSATVTFEATIDGTNYFAFPAVNIGTGVLATTTTSAGQFAFRCAGYQNVRARISAYTSGNVTVVGRATSNGQGHHSVSIANIPQVVASANIPTSTTITIANGASLSGSADLAGFTLIGIIMPSGWTAADITLQASLDNSNFFNIYDSFGNELTIKTDASRFIPLTPSDYVPVRYIKVRSGTSGSAVNQGAERVITLVYRAV